MLNIALIEKILDLKYDDEALKESFIKGLELNAQDLFVNIFKKHLVLASQNDEDLEWIIDLMEVEPDLKSMYERKKEVEEKFKLDFDKMFDDYFAALQAVQLDFIKIMCEDMSAEDKKQLSQLLDEQMEEIKDSHRQFDVFSKDLLLGLRATVNH